MSLCCPHCFCDHCGLIRDGHAVADKKTALAVLAAVPGLYAYRPVTCYSCHFTIHALYNCAVVESMERKGGDLALGEYTGEMRARG